MKEFIEKLIGRLEERKQLHNRLIAYEQKSGTITEEFQQRKAVEVLDDAIEIVNQLAEEYNNDATKTDYGSIIKFIESEIERTTSFSEHDTQINIMNYVQQLQEQNNNGWIPCSERLPEVFENVLICTKEGGRAIGHRCPNQKPGRYYDLHGSAIDNVIAWRYLPNPYIPDKE